MDPLSLIANIIPIVSAAKKAAQVLERLYSTRNAPEQLLLLLNEVADFRAIVTVLQETVSKLELQDQEPSFDISLKGSLGKAFDILEQISTLSEPILIGDPGNPKERVDIHWKKWLKDHGKLQGYCERMRIIRTELANATTLLNACEIPRVRVTLKNLSLGYSKVGNQMAAVAENISTMGSSINTLQDTLQSIHNFQSRPLPRPLHPVMRNSETSRSSHSMLRVQTYVEPSCSILCMCACHRTRTLQSPAWLKGLLGLLFIGYTGIPLLQNGQVCTEKLCRRNGKGLIVLTYYFPAWFIARMIRIRDQWTPTDGHMLSVRTPRVVHVSKYLDAVATGNIPQIQTMFMQGQASPFDTHFVGFSGLMLAVTNKRADTCKSLLQQYADPHEPSAGYGNQTPVQVVYQYYLRDPDDARIQKIYEIFEPYLDPEELVREKGFTPLHKIVIGLSSLELKLQLELSTADIDTPDNEGWTPLFWAVRKADVSAVKLLLEFGAALDKLSTSKRNVFHVVAHLGQSAVPVFKLLAEASILTERVPAMQTFTCGLKKLSLSTIDRAGNGYPEKNAYRRLCSNANLTNLINQCDQHGRTPLQWATQQSNVELIRLFISNGVSLDQGTPILFATALNSHNVLEELLIAGARTDLSVTITKSADDQGGIFHYAACHGDLVETLKILKKWNVRNASVEKNLRGYTPLEEFDVQRSAYCPEDEETRRKSREIFLELLEKATRFQSRITELQNPESEIPGSFENANAMDNSTPDSDSEEFFEANPFFEEIEEVVQVFEPSLLDT